MRAWFNGRMEASQALDEGSIPFARFFNQDTFMENENLDLDVKPAGNKDLWLFLIIIDIVLLCVFGFFIYKYFAAGLFQTAPLSGETAVEETVAQPQELAEVTVPETGAVQEAAPQPQAAPMAEPEEISVLQVLEAQAKAAAQKPAETPQPQTPAREETKQSVLVEKNAKSKYRQVTFRWYGEGEKVAVVSGFTNRKPKALTQKDTYWETTLAIAPGTYKFLYVVDGKNTLDPYSPQKDGRSVLVIE